MIAPAVTAAGAWSVLAPLQDGGAPTRGVFS